MNQSIPPEAQTELLTVIKGWHDTVAALGSKERQRFVSQTNSFNFTVWLFQTNDSALETEFVEFKKLVASLAFGQASTLDRLPRILELVPQLKAACLTPLGLASALDVLLFNLMETSPLAKARVSDEQLIEHLTAKVFEQPYSRMALVHLYNLKIDRPVIELPQAEARIMNLTETDLPLITGEPTLTSTLHYRHGGSCFLVYEDSSCDDVSEWLSTKWDEAWKFISVLKYLKSGLVDIDYAARFFKPTWVNKVRRYGIDIMGRPRWDEQPEPYHLDDATLPELTLYMNAAKKLEIRLSDFSSRLRRTIAFAGDRYEYHHTRMKLEDQLIELVIALEALFSPQHEGEL